MIKSLKGEENSKIALGYYVYFTEREIAR